MRINHIVKYDLESRAKDLKGAGKTLEEISNILSKEAKTTITVSTVYRYFESNEKANAQAVEKSDKLKAKVADAEINTIEKRLKIVDFLLKIAVDTYNAGDSRAAILALRAATEAQDSLDERLGKLTPAPTNNINILNIQEQAENARERFTNSVLRLANRESEN